MNKIEFKVNPRHNEFFDLTKCVYCGRSFDIINDQDFNEIGDITNIYCRPCDKKTNILIQGITYEYSVVPENDDDRKEFFRQKKEAIEKIKREIINL